MDTFSRHLLSETLKTFAVALGVSIAILTLVGSVQQAVRHGLPVIVTAQVLPFVGLEMLRFTIPAALLFAVCSVVGRAAATNEFVAIKAAGISPWRPILSLVIFSYLLSIGTYGIYELCARWSRPGLQTTLVKAIDDIAYARLNEKGYFRSAEFAVRVQEVNHRTLVAPRIDLFSKDDQPHTFLAADAAELRFDQENNLLFVCRNAHVEIEDVGHFHFPEEIARPIPLHNNLTFDEETASPAALPGNRLGRQTSRETARVNALLASPLADNATEVQKSQRQQELFERRERLFRLHAENQRRLANGFSCLSFVIFGIPIALWLKTADTPTTFFLSFLPILLAYYPLLMVGETTIRQGMLVPYGIWIANLALMLAGSLMLRASLRR